MRTLEYLIVVVFCLGIAWTAATTVASTVADSMAASAQTIRTAGQ
jgi:hypothetical protein